MFIQPSHYNKKNYWLVKAPNLNRGRCIKISDNISKIQKILKKFNEGIIREFKESEEEDKISDNKYLKTHERIKELSNKEEESKVPGDNLINSNVAKKYKSSIIIVQKYIERPFLYFNRKSRN